MVHTYRCAREAKHSNSVESLGQASQNVSQRQQNMEKHITGLEKTFVSLDWLNDAFAERDKCSVLLYFFLDLFL